MAYEIPDVFSFFLPNYAAPGNIALSELTSPEAMLSHYSIGLVNGIISLVEFG